MFLIFSKCRQRKLFSYFCRIFNLIVSSVCLNKPCHHSTVHEHTNIVAMHGNTLYDRERAFTATIQATRLNVRGQSRIESWASRWDVPYVVP